MTIPVIIKGIKTQLTTQDVSLCTREPIQVKRLEDDGSICEYVYLEIDAESVMRFADQNEYNSWRDKNGSIPEEINL